MAGSKFERGPGAEAGTAKATADPPAPPAFLENVDRRGVSVVAPRRYHPGTEGR